MSALMAWLRTLVVWLGLATSAVWAKGDTSPVVATAVSSTSVYLQVPHSTVPVEIPLDQIPDAKRDAIRRILEHPTLFVPGPVEIFRGKAAYYHRLLDHPDQGVRIWRRLGAKCMDIADQGASRFCWSDGQGTDIRWETVHQDSRLRVWYAEGKSRPALLLPTVPLRAVVVLHHVVASEDIDRTLIKHRADLYLQTDSKTAQLIARLLGPSAPRLAEQGVAQLEMFFSALVWYLDRHPDRAASLFE